MVTSCRSPAVFSRKCLRAENACRKCLPRDIQLQYSPVHKIRAFNALNFETPNCPTLIPLLIIMYTRMHFFTQLFEACRSLKCTSRSYGGYFRATGAWFKV